MIIHTTPLFTAYFGSAQDGLSAQQYKEVVAQHTVALEPFDQLKKTLHINECMFLRQTHSNDGAIITHETAQQIKPFAVEGDYLITRDKIILGVLTADCLPVVIHDPVHNVVAVVHAGWRGSVKKVVVKALEMMQQQYATQIDHVRILFGPSAKICCYKVSPEFVQELDAFSYAPSVIVQHGGDYFFDLPAFNRLQLEELGIKKDAMCLKYTSCTICTPTFNSYRRDGEHSGRQITAVCLR